MRKFNLLFAALVLFCTAAAAQKKDAAQMAKQANNPLASITTISLHDVYSPRLYGLSGSANTTWIRAVQPIGGKVLIRASLPVNTLSTESFERSGLGDMNIFATFILTDPSAHNQFGIGPIVTMPTATSSKLGAGKWQAGVALAGYFAKSDILQLGILATWQHSFAGDDDRRKVHAGTIQPFVILQMGKGAYLRSTATNVLDFEQGNYLIPLGAGIGKVVRAGKIILNFFAEPQFTVWYEGAGMPKMQFYMGINAQF